MTTSSGISSSEDQIYRTALSVYLSDEPIFPEEPDIFSDFESTNENNDLSDTSYPSLFAPLSTPSSQISNPSPSNSIYPISVFDIDLSQFYINDTLTKKTLRDMSPMERYLFTEERMLDLSSECQSQKQQPDAFNSEHALKAEDIMYVASEDLIEDPQAYAASKKTKTTIVQIGSSLDSGYSMAEVECTYDCVYKTGRVGHYRKEL